MMCVLVAVSVGVAVGVAPARSLVGQAPGETGPRRAGQVLA